MPKKFKGENTKAAAARERKQAAKHEVEEKKRQAEEDVYWKDDDKHSQRKQDRRAERERKRQEQLDKKQEAKLLLAEEEEQVGGKTSKGASAATKVTRAQISEAEEKRKRESEASSASALPKRVSIDEPALELNPNLEAQQRRMAGELEARTVDEAIAVLSVGKETTQERHPERRVKAAYAAYEERELPRLKEENPNLRLSQLKQLLRKEWMKSPENPMNQHHLAYNSKT